jgi:hypothetical protein
MTGLLLDQTVLVVGRGSGSARGDAAGTCCPYQGLCSYHHVGGARRAAWSSEDAWPEAGQP